MIETRSRLFGSYYTKLILRRPVLRPSVIEQLSYIKSFSTFVECIGMDKQNRVIFIVWSLQTQWKRKYTIDKFPNKAFQVSLLFCSIIVPIGEIASDKHSRPCLCLHYTDSCQNLRKFKNNLKWIISGKNKLHSSQTRIHPLFLLCWLALLLFNHLHCHYTSRYPFCGWRKK